MDIRRATPTDLALVAPLFDAYRQFYDKPADPGLARDFVAARLTREESTILLAVDDDGRALGFTQLYPLFSSLSARPMLILSDLYVAPGARRRGVARALLLAARRYGESTGAERMELQTAHTNTAAQALYESLGWIHDREFRTYALPLAG
jgi:ribosomal protein S18 acetylase RimI-like enzyme